MAMTLKNSLADVSAGMLDDLQRRQNDHDARYHPEISNLPVADRLSHIIHHFGKYAGRLVADPSQTSRVAVDTYIMALSGSNVLKLRLSDVFQRAPTTLTRLDALALTSNRDRLSTGLAVGAGLMCEAREKLDHVEDFNFRKVMSEGLELIFCSVMDFYDFELSKAASFAELRLQGVREKSFFARTNDVLERR